MKPNAGSPKLLTMASNQGVEISTPDKLKNCPPLLCAISLSVCVLAFSSEQNEYTGADHALEVGATSSFSLSSISNISSLLKS